MISNSSNIMKLNFLYFRQIGMKMVRGHFPDFHSKSDDRAFRSVFGTSWNVVADIWNLIDEHGDSKKKTPAHLLWALVFIKSYGNEQSHCMQVGGDVTLKTFRKWTWIILEEMSEVSAIKVRKERFCFKINPHKLTISDFYSICSSYTDKLGKSKKRRHRQSLPGLC